MNTCLGRLLIVSMVSSMVACGSDETVTGPEHAEIDGGQDISQSLDAFGEADVSEGEVVPSLPDSAAFADAAADIKVGEDSAAADVDAQIDASDADVLVCLVDDDCPVLGDPCAQHHCSDAGVCVILLSPVGTLCDDGDLCTVGEACQGGGCVGGAALGCDDDNPCTSDTCVSFKGCVHKNNSFGCEDGDQCTAGDTCVAGKCAGGAPQGCNDGNPCTKDGCDPLTGCTHLPTAAPCDDGDFCTVKDSCVGGSCVSGLLRSCDDNNACTDDACDALKGCVSLSNSATCSDGNACTVKDSCAGGSCQAGQAIGCDDDDLCTSDYCLPAVGCTVINNNLPCDDGDACTQGDACDSGACAGGEALSCADGNPCTDDVCDSKIGCVSTPNKAPCDDGNKCTLKDVCSGGVCTPGKAPDCDDGNPCTSATCEPGLGCKNVPNSLSCSDGDLCTVGDVCVGGTCKSGEVVPCDDGNVCTTESCDKTKGCVALPSAGTCSDDNLCTVGDVCGAGVCVAGEALLCDDGNGCTMDLCKPFKGCVAVPNTASCDDGDICTLGDKCSEAACTSGKALSCDDGNLCTDNGCDKVKGCVFSSNAASCDDGNACTASDGCAKGSCAGQAVVCDDGNVCTVDYCDSVLGCRVVPKLGPCSDGSVCTVSDACAGGKCVGKALSCDDGNPCTKDGCDPQKGCAHVALVDGSSCGGAGSCAAGKCLAGTKAAPGLSCSELRDLGVATQNGVFWIDPDLPKGPLKAFQVRCDVGHQGGGWTLVATSSDDGQATWTWTHRKLFSDDTKTFGKISEPGRDFKSLAYHQVAAQQVLFVHQPSGVWAWYEIGDGKLSLGAIQTAWGDPKCVDVFKQGFPLGGGNLKVSGKLCSDRLFWAVQDMDGTPGCGDDDHSYGPTWSARSNAATCPMDDPGFSGGLGPVWYSKNKEASARGFAGALKLNTGKSGAGQNYLQIYVREVPKAGCGDGILQAGEACDDGNKLAGDGCDPQCQVEGSFVR